MVERTYRHLCLKMPHCFLIEAAAKFSVTLRSASAQNFSAFFLTIGRPFPGIEGEIVNRMSGAPRDRNDVSADPPALGESSLDVLSFLDDPIRSRADAGTAPTSTKADTPYITESPAREGGYSDDELESALATQLRGAGLPAAAMISSVVDYARAKSCALLFAEDYDAAAEIDTAIDIMLSSLASEQTASVRGEQLATLKLRLSLALQIRREIVAAWEMRIADFRREADDALGRMAARHEMERRDFQSEWSRPEALVPFSKPSPTLLQLRKMQKTLALTHDYAGAKQIKEECQRLTREESAAGGQRATEAMRSAFLQLRERQQREVECFDEHGRQHIASLEAQRDAELRANEKLQRQLRTKVAAGRKTAKVVVPSVRQTAKGFQMPMSGKIMRQLYVYKTENEPRRLDIRIESMDGLMRRIDSENAGGPTVG
jgi:hypothetical protein